MSYSKTREFSLNSKASIKFIEVGKESVLLVDNFVADYNYLKEFACQQGCFAKEVYYPGLRAKVPEEFIENLKSFLQQEFAQNYDFSMDCKVSFLSITYALVTSFPEQLNLAQRMPHIDSNEENQWAIVIYLFDDDLGGTSFYRHRSTGLETVSKQDEQSYKAALRADLMKKGLPKPAYICGDTAIFERIAKVEAKPNRAIIYKGRSLHSGDIASTRAVSSDPSSGRLTISAFFTIQ